MVYRESNVNVQKKQYDFDESPVFEPSGVRLKTKNKLVCENWFLAFEPKL